MKNMNDLNIKNSIIIFNRKYEILYPLKVNEVGEDASNTLYTIGLASFDEQTISLRSSSHAESQLRTFFHEVAHIAFYEYAGTNETIDVETACDAVSALLYDMCHNFDIKYKEAK